MAQVIRVCPILIPLEKAPFVIGLAQRARIRTLGAGWRDDATAKAGGSAD